MSDDASSPGAAAWPIPVFRFRVTLGDNLQGIFQEVSGMEAQAQVIEFRHGSSPLFSTTKIPSLQRLGNVALKHGIFKAQQSFWDWYSSIGQNLLKRHTVVIELLDESNGTQMKWTLNEAWPIKVSVPNLQSEGDEVAVQALDLAFESLEINSA